MEQEMEQETADRALDMVESFAAKLETLATELGPEVGELALATARIDALSNIFPGIFISTAAGFVVYWYLSRMGMWGKTVNDSVDSAVYGPAMTKIMGGGIAAVVAGLIGASYALNWLSIWPWVGLYEPKMWIAYKVLGL